MLGPHTRTTRLIWAHDEHCTLTRLSRAARRVVWVKGATSSGRRNAPPAMAIKIAAQ